MIHESGRREDRTYSESPVLQWRQCTFIPAKEVLRKWKRFHQAFVFCELGLISWWPVTGWSSAVGGKPATTIYSGIRFQPVCVQTQGSDRTMATSPFNIFLKWIYFSLHVHACVHVWEYAQECWCPQRPERALDLLELEVQVAVGCPCGCCDPH